MTLINQTTPAALFGKKPLPSGTYNPLVKNFKPTLSLNATPFIPPATGATDPKSSFIANKAQSTPPPQQQSIAPAPTQDVFAAGANTPSGATVNPNGQVTAPQPTAADTAFETYLNSLTPSSETKAATEYLNSLATQGQLANERALNSGDTLGFAAGEAQRVGRNFDIKLAGAASAANALAALDAKRGDISKARYDYERGKIDEAIKAEQFDRRETRLENPDFELSPGQSRFAYDPLTKEYRRVGSLPSRPTTTQPRGTITSGGLTYSTTAAAEDSQALESSRDRATGYVDSGVYQELYNAWIREGGILKDFLSTYPPKNYADPNDKNLPSYLRPTGSGGVVNPFRT